MEFLQNLVNGSDLPVLTAFVLGLMTAISPCPLATNITATAYLSKDIAERRRVLLNGVFYTLGRVFSYTALGVVFFLGASKFQIARLLQSVSGLYLGIALVVVGILLLDLVKINLPGMNQFRTGFGQSERKKTYWNAFLLGLVFALAFCPYSGVLYFGVLIPMVITSPSGLLLPPVFAIATGLPVIVIAYLIAYSMASVGGFYNKMKTYECWIRRIVAFVFIVVGLYYCIVNM